VITSLTADDLRQYAEHIAALFNSGAIRHPVHLDGGNEELLLQAFQDIREEDWICGQWRMHSKCLLKGVPPEKLTAAIMQGRSISLCFPEYRIVSSGIAGGHLPIALGIALGIKMSGGRERVHVFLGDMVSMSGIASECSLYAYGHNLPIRFIIEDNGKSVCTDTQKTWGTRFTGMIRYERHPYELPWPHSGAGKRVVF
jgi:pyruvate dehydrogenase E1 component alpha subunit